MRDLLNDNCRLYFYSGKQSCLLLIFDFNHNVLRIDVKEFVLIVQQPVFVMGMGRSGTRTFADALACHKSIALQGEIPHAASINFFKLLDCLDKEHSRDSVRKSKWISKKAQFIFSSFKYLSQGVGINYDGAIFVGHKTPRSEKFIPHYEKHFLSCKLSPVYFYCIRNPVDVWRSYKAMPWNTIKSVHDFVNMYVNSYNYFINAEKKCKGRVHLLNLENYKRSEDKIKFMEQGAFSILRLKLNDIHKSKIMDLRNTNSAKNKFGINLSNLEDDEILYINKMLFDIIKAHDL